METLRMVAGWTALVFTAALGLYILISVFTGKIDLQYVISDKDNEASLGRFQALVFTFVVGLSFLFFVTAPDATGLPEVPGSVLALLGISGSAFLVSKSLDK